MVDKKYTETKQYILERQLTCEQVQVELNKYRTEINSLIIDEVVCECEQCSDLIQCPIVTECVACEEII